MLASGDARVADEHDCVKVLHTCVLIGCGGDLEQPAATPAPAITSLEIVAEFETDWEVEREYCAETAGRYVLEASAPDGEPLASVHLYRPDATGETPRRTSDEGDVSGEFVAMALRTAGEPRRVRSEPFELGAECVVMFLQTGIRGSTVQARLRRE